MAGRKERVRGKGKIYNLQFSKMKSKSGIIKIVARKPQKLSD